MGDLLLILIRVVKFRRGVRRSAALNVSANFSRGQVKRMMDIGLREIPRLRSGMTALEIRKRRAVKGEGWRQQAAAGKDGAVGSRKTGAGLPHSKKNRHEQ
jgi:hypothetical protein